jgi:hypothetical protein
MPRFIFVYLLLLVILIDEKSLHVFGEHNLSTYASLLILGDSVDRYMVKDWCQKSGNILTERSHERSNASISPLTVHELLKPYGMRRKSWDIWICESCTEKKIVATIANKFGVKAYPPWHMPIATMSGLDHEVLLNNTNYSNLFNIGLKPAFKPLIAATTGKDPTGIMLNSAFWDLSHPDLESFRESNKNGWVDSWAANTSALMKLMKRSFTNTKWFAWHTANKFYPGRGHWNTPLALNLLLTMNERSKEVAGENGYEWIDFAGKINSAIELVYPLGVYRFTEGYTSLL